MRAIKFYSVGLFLCLFSASVFAGGKHLMLFSVGPGRSIQADAGSGNRQRRHNFNFDDAYGR